MSETTFSIEFAKSGRSKCKRCKEPIAKGEIRMSITVPAKDSSSFDMVSHFHPRCFRMPKKYADMEPEDFVREYVTDTSDNQEILPAKVDEIAKALAEAAAAAAKPQKRKGKQDDAAAAAPSLMGRIKQAATGTPPKKKAKHDTITAAEFDKMVAGYEDHHKSKVDHLKDYLRWNRQLLMGKKDFVLFKVLDGEIHGRLGHCPLDGGNLKLQEGDEDHVYCQGRFDEDMNMRIPCDFKGDRSDAKLRLQPWFQQEPTEEEKEEMDKIRDESRGEGTGAATEAGEGLIKAAVKFDWDLTDRGGIQKATSELIELVSGKVDLPKGKDPKRLLGPMIVAQKDKSPSEIVKEVIAKYGFQEDKEEQAAAKEAAMEKACENPKNAPLLVAFQELSKLYFKDGNRNAGASYQKVVNSLKELAVEVTADNAMSLSKGKTKVPGIGKSSAEKMKEFMETGTMEKLEEKRASQA